MTWALFKKDDVLEGDEPPMVNIDDRRDPMDENPPSSDRSLAVSETPSVSKSLMLFLLGFRKVLFPPWEEVVDLEEESELEDALDGLMKEGIIHCKVVERMSNEKKECVLESVSECERVARDDEVVVEETF